MAQYSCHSASTHLTRDQASRVLSAAGFAAAQLQTMVAIGIAESNLGIDAIGDCGLPPPRVGYRSFGIWQILQSPDDQDNRAQITDLLTAQGNANAAHGIYNRQGYNAWSTYKNGAYKAHLNGDGGGGGIPGAGVVSNVGGAVADGAKAVGGAITGTAGGIADAAKAFVHGAEWFANRHNWIRILEVIAGLIAVVIGLVIVNRDSIGAGLKEAGKAAAVAAAA